MRTARRAILGTLVAGPLVAVVGYSAVRGVRGPEACRPGPAGVALCVASELDRLPPAARVPAAPWLYDPVAPRVALEAARDETVAFQLLLRGQRATRATVEMGDLAGPERIRAGEWIELSQAIYVKVDQAGHRWGEPSRVLPWPERYPDALVPLVRRCDDRSGPPLGDVPVPAGETQAVWVDVHVPREAPPGRYAGALRVTVEGQRAEIEVVLQVKPATLPLVPSLDAVAEIYEPYAREGGGTDLGSEAFRRLAACTQRLAHRHRMVMVERTDRVPPGWGAPGDGPALTDGAEDPYARSVGGALDGSWFDPAHGYRGPGARTPVAVWRTPWPQPWSERVDTPIEATEIARLGARAARFSERARALGWRSTRFFAYLFDEVDGGTDEAAAAAAPAYVARVHGEMRRVQAALDAGAAPTRIDLLWTSHQDPRRWIGDAARDLVGSIRLWAPNARAADPSFLRARVAAGERAWFYHAGHPHLGTLVINAPGADLASWPLVAARYGLSGFLVWAANLGDARAPISRPTYKDGDDRFGNGTLFYPGAALPEVGLPALAEPLPSMRLRALRRGLYLADLVAMARQRGGAEVDRALARFLPRALGEGKGAPAWPTDPLAWFELRRGLLEMASR